MSLSLLNFACGSRIHPDWINIDFSPIDKRVKKVNLLGTLPFTDKSFDVAYSSHFLEHLTPQKALQILKEIKRILKPNGIVRIVVPDLENLASTYLSTLSRLVDSTRQNFDGGGGQIKLLDKNLQGLSLNMIGYLLKCLIKWCVCKVAEKWGNASAK